MMNVNGFVARDPYKQVEIENAVRLASSVSGLAKLGVFGSVAQRTDTPGSDVDLYLEWKGETWDDEGFYVGPLNDLMRSLKRVSRGICGVDLLIYEKEDEEFVGGKRF